MENGGMNMMLQLARGFSITFRASFAFLDEKMLSNGIKTCI